VSVSEAMAWGVLIGLVVGVIAGVLGTLAYSMRRI
jgi:F0F1-type ATP synthase assembly protein I